MTDLEEIPDRRPDFIFNRIRANDFATYGHVLKPGDEEDVRWVTIERPWVDADKDGHRDRSKSRFVPGLYRAFRRKSYKNGGTGKRDYDVWEFASIPDVDNAQIHVANLPHQLEGCVALGLAFGDVPHEAGDKLEPGVIGSRTAIGQFMTATMAKSELWIEVRDSFQEEK